MKRKIWKVSNFCRNCLIQEQLMKMNLKRKGIVLLQNGDTFLLKFFKNPYLKFFRFDKLNSNKYEPTFYSN